MATGRTYRRVSHPASGKGRTNQDDARGTDINVLVAQYMKNGTMPNVYVGDPLWGDFTSPDDLQSCFERWQLAKEKFNDLPATVREAADHDPVQFLRMFDDEGGRQILVDNGLAVDDERNEGNQPPPPKPNPVVPPTNEVAEPPAPAEPEPPAR